MMLSRYTHSDEPIEVEHAYGFYGMPSTNRLFHGSVKWLMSQFGLGVDLLPGNQGQLLNERSRYLTLGKGLHEFSIEVPHPVYKDLVQRCEQQIKQERQAREEICQRLKLDPIKDSDKVYQEELRCAKAEARPSRLKPFHFKASILDQNGWFSFAESKTCKTTTIELFREVGIPEILVDYISGSGKWPALPRFGGKLQSAYFFAEGPLSIYETEASFFQKCMGYPSIQRNSFRDWRDGQTKLYWIVPPQNLVSFDKDFVNRTSVPTALQSEVFDCVSQLQQLENMVVNSDLNYPQKDLVQYIRGYYINFACDSANTARIRESLASIKQLYTELYWSMSDFMHDSSISATQSAFLLPKNTKHKITELLGMAEIENKYESSQYSFGY